MATALTPNYALTYLSLRRGGVAAGRPSGEHSRRRGTAHAVVTAKHPAPAVLQMLVRKRRRRVRGGGGCLRLRGFRSGERKRKGIVNSKGISFLLML